MKKKPQANLNISSFILSFILIISNHAHSENFNLNTNEDNQVTCSCCRVLTPLDKVLELRKLVNTSTNFTVFLNALEEANKAIRNHDKIGVFLEAWTISGYTSQHKRLEELTEIVATYAVNAADLSVDELIRLTDFMYHKTISGRTYEYIFWRLIQKKAALLTKETVTKDRLKIFFRDVMKANTGARKWSGPPLEVGNSRRPAIVDYLFKTHSRKPVYKDILKSLYTLRDIGVLGSASTYTAAALAIKEVEDESKRFLNPNPLEYENISIRGNDLLVQFLINNALEKGKVEDVSVEDYRILYNMTPDFSRRAVFGGVSSVFGMNWLQSKSEDDLLKIFSINPQLSEVYLTYTLNVPSMDFMTDIVKAIGGEEQGHLSSELWKLYWARQK